ncbi:MAG: 50S ribosomal protein L11 methyltransferase [Usitatibacter sp.]
MYTIHDYGEMIANDLRTKAYERALSRSISPGAVVLDIGTGTGVFAMLACRLGARRVFAIEPGDAIQVAREIAAANGFSERIEFIQGLSTEIELPERADVIVSDLHGILPLFDQHLVAVADARSRHLAPGGLMIPEQETLWVAAVEAPAQYAALTLPWEGAVAGLDMKAARPLVINTFYRSAAGPEHIVAGPQQLGTLDYRQIESPRFTGTANAVAARKARAHGLCVWFDSVLATGVAFSNAPGSPRLIYGRAFFPWTEPVDLDVGDQVVVSMRADLVGTGYIWSWNTRISNAAGKPKAQMRQSEFDARELSPASLRKQAASHVPRLNEDGLIDQLILRMMGEERPLGEIAAEVAARHPARFPRALDALSRASDLSLRYSR